jgi:hypothetical protein
MVVSQIKGIGWTVVYAAWFQALIHSLHAKVAGLDDVLCRIILRRSERAGFDTGFTPDAQFFIEEDNSIGPHRYGVNGTCAQTGRFSAMPATIGRKTHDQFPTPFPGADFRDADPVFSLGNIMLLFAGHYTSETAYTFIRIEKE